MKNEGDKTMKKVLLTSAVALAAFGAVQAVSADTNSRFGSQFDKYRQPNAHFVLLSLSTPLSTPTALQR